MTTYWKFYLPESHPTGLSGVVGGAISTQEVQSNLDSVFAHMEGNELSDVTQYRKLFAKQVESGSFENVLIEVANVEYPTHISFAVTGISGDVTGQSSDPDTLPDGYTVNMFSGDYSQSLTGLATSNYGDYIGIWVKETIPANSEYDELASFVLRVRATRID